MLRRFHEAKEDGKSEVELWGSGTPKREFMHADDLATSCIHLMLNYSDREPINVGTGEEHSIAGLAELVKEAVGFSGSIIWNTEMPDGTPRKLLDSSKLRSLGFKHQISLLDGLKSTYSEMKKQLSTA
jgi:GDP-L-fucose synthase